jgi:cation diffusion facilitator CzcD-associated flavoprotein CzcO
VTPRRRRLLVVGAGPHGLTACAYFAAANPDILDDSVVVDPAGWLGAWNQKLEALDIEWLRSSCVHHPHPKPFQLIEWSQMEAAHVRGPYKAPSRRFFARFCDDVCTTLDLERRLLRDRVVGLLPHSSGVLVTLASGRTVDAERVVMATNPRRNRVPAWAATTQDAALIAHASDVDLRTAEVAGQRVAVVGGGLTAVQLAIGAARRGARVTLLARRPLHQRTFDVTAGWMTYKLERLLTVSDPARRLRAVRAARGRGTVPPEDLDILRDHARHAQIKVGEGVSVDHVATDGSALVAHTSAGRMHFDRMWLATGSHPDLFADPCLRRLHASLPATLVGGIPVLDAHCRWPGTSIHLMGELSCLQTGPIAPNLAGARIAAERIASAAGLRPWQYPLPASLRQSEPARHAPVVMQ